MPPNIELRAPNVRFSKEQVDNIRKLTGIVDVEGLDQDATGRFAAIRISFVSNEVMQKYIDGAGLARS